MATDGGQVTLSGAETTDLVNVRKHGREGVTMIDRSSKFGNPFKMEKDGGEYTRRGASMHIVSGFSSASKTMMSFEIVSRTFEAKR